MSNSVCVVARHSHNLTERHWVPFIKIMADLHGAMIMGLAFAKGSGLHLTANSDADYPGKSNDRSSVSGILIMLGCAAVSEISSTQNRVTLSTQEAEYVAFGEWVKEVY